RQHVRFGRQPADPARERDLATLRREFDGQPMREMLAELLQIDARALGGDACFRTIHGACEPFVTSRLCCAAPESALPRRRWRRPQPSPLLRSMAPRRYAAPT